MDLTEDRWVEERDSYYIQTGSSFQNPYGVPHRELGRMILEQGAAMIAQTVFGKLVPDDGAIFTFDLVHGLFRGYTGDPVNTTVWLDEETQAEAAELRAAMRERGQVLSSPRFVGGADLARKKDATVIFVLDLRDVPQGPARVVYYRRVERVPWDSVYAELGLAAWLFDAELLLDSTGAGDVVAEEAEDRGYCAKHHVANPVGHRCVDHNYQPRDCDPSDYHTIRLDRFHFSTTTKVQLITNLAQCLGDGFDQQQPDKPYGLIRSPRIPKLQEQLPLYRFEDKKLETDEVMGIALAAWHGLRDFTGPPAIGAVC